jgi:hypothetical protein
MTPTRRDFLILLQRSQAQPVSKRGQTILKTGRRPNAKSGPRLIPRAKAGRLP